MSFINKLFIFLFSCHNILTTFTVLKITLLGQYNQLFRRDDCDFDSEINFSTLHTDPMREQKLSLSLSDQLVLCMNHEEYISFLLLLCMLPQT